MRTTVLALLLALPLPALASGFQFKVPPGWVDLSPGAPPANFAGLPPTLVQQIKAGNFAFYAADLAHADDGFMENVNATVEAGSEKISQKLVDEMAAHLGDEVEKQAPGVSVKVVEKRLVDWSGVTVARLVVELGGSIHARQVQYLLPGPTEHAVVTYSTTPEQFATYQATFDAAAQATGGVAEPPGRLSKIGRAAGHGGLIGAIAGAIGGLAAAFVARSRKKSANPPAA